MVKKEATNVTPENIIEDAKETETKVAPKDDDRIPQVEIDSFNLSLLSMLRDFTDKAWISKDKIVVSHKTESNPPRKLAIRYRPENPIFSEEFGIRDLSKFISLLSLFDKANIEYSLPHIVVKDDHSVVTYKTATKEIFEKIIEANDDAELLIDESRKLVEENKYLSFDLDEKLIKKLKKAGSSITTASQPTKIIFEKEKDDDDIVIRVKNADSAFDFSEVVTSDNVGQISNFNKSFLLDILPNGNWKVFLFDSIITFKNQQVPIVWCYLQNKETQGLEMIILYNIAKSNKK